MKSYYVYYYRKGEGETTFNQNRIQVRAKSVTDAIQWTKKKLGKLWTIEKAVRA